MTGTVAARARCRKPPIDTVRIKRNSRRMKMPPPSFPPGVVMHPEAGLRRILAPNPGPMTLWGTSTYLVGTGDVALVDPGPDMTEHLDAILDATGTERISHILVTHSHKDHDGLTARLREATDAPVYGFPTEGGLTPDIALADGDIIQGATWQLEAIHTPGHIDDHFCFGFGDVCLTGDHVMGWSSTVIIPPRGAVDAYIASLDKLAARDWRRLHSAHGDPMDDPAERLAYLRRHRIARGESVFKALQRKPMTLESLVTQLYATTPRNLHGAATRNVEAHLIDLIRSGRVRKNQEDQHFHTLA